MREFNMDLLTYEHDSWRVFRETEQKILSGIVADQSTVLVAPCLSCKQTAGHTADCALSFDGFAQRDNEIEVK